MGDAQLAGIHYLEKEIKAVKIVIAGRSLGGAAVGQAILRYPFDVKNSGKYVVIRQMSFSRTSDVCAEIAGMDPLTKKIISFMIWWTGLEMDSVAASKRLEELGIQEVIVQGGNQSDKILQDSHFGDDHVIPKQASLGYHVFLREMKHKTYMFQREMLMERELYDHMHESSISLPGILKLINQFGVS